MYVLCWFRLKEATIFILCPFFCKLPKDPFWPNSFISHHIFITIINLWIIHHYKLEHLSHYQFICPKQSCKNIVCDQLNFIRSENAVVLCYIMSLKGLILELQQTLMDSYKHNSSITVWEWVAYFYSVMIKIQTKYIIGVIIGTEKRNRQQDYIKLSRKLY